MNPKIEFIKKHGRFPFSTTEKVILSTLLFSILIAAIAIIYNDPNWLTIIIVASCAILFSAMIYFGLASSLKFRKIPTGFKQIKNEKIIKMCLRHLNMKAYMDKEYKNVFVCFIHDKNSYGRQEIYLIAKDDGILINSNRNKESEDDVVGIDFMEKIGLSIYITAKQLRDMQRHTQSR